MEYSVGLSGKEVEVARQRFGRNEIVKKSRVGAFPILVSQVKSPLIYILLIASFINLFVGRVTDSMVIMLAVVVNTALGFIQEYKAEKSLESLANLIVPKAKVRREKEWKVIDATLLVPGDVVRLEVGQIVPADGVLTRATDLFVNEAIISGESFPVEKNEFVFEEDFMIYKFQLHETEPQFKCQMGTVIERGIGELLVVKTGMETELGKIAASLKLQTVGKTPLHLKLANLARMLALLVLITVPIIVLVGIVSGKGLNEIFLIGLALAVSAIPEGLAVSLTAILTVGMRRILGKKALVRKLAAAETLGNTDIICLDKTGTVTLGKMKVVDAITSLDDKKIFQEKYDLLIKGTILCNDERDPLEAAMMKWGREQMSINKLEVVSAYRRVGSLPFDHRYKYIVTRHVTEKGEALEFISGAPEVVLQRSEIRDKDSRGNWEAKFAELGRKGYRLVGFGVKTEIRDQSREAGSSQARNSEISREEVKDYDWLGVITFEDPVREGAASSLQKIINAGIGVKIVTGDYKETAWSVLSAVGLVENKLDENLVITGDELAGASASRVERAVLFARVSPEQKLHIVKALQSLNHVVAMTGDGVNDAPALKQADIGVVVGEASDVARETAELVLLDNNLETILAAVEEGRAMLDNLRKVVLYLLADAFVGIFLVVAALLLNWPLPLLATQILWINLISDGFPYMALAVEPKAADLLLRKPVSKNEPIVDRKMLFLIAVISFTAGLLTLSVFGLYLFVFNQSLLLARTVTLATLGGITLTYVFSVRSLFVPIWKNGLFSNKWLWLGVLGGMMLTLTVVYWRPLQHVFGTVSLSLSDWGYVAMASILVLVAAEGAKWWLSRRRRD